MVERDRLAAGSGIGAVTVTMGAILAATVVSPAFRWDGNALSNLGVTATAAGTDTTVLLFNGGLILGGLLGLVFGAVLVRRAASTVGRLTGAAFALAVVFMGLVGVFPQDRPLHFPVALGFYLLVSLTLWLDGLRAWLSGSVRHAAVGAGLGTVNIAGWLAWGLTGPVTRPGLAIPELVGAAAFSLWTVSASRRVVAGRWSAPTGSDAGL